MSLNLAYMWYLDKQRQAKNLHFSTVSKIVLMSIVIVIQPICISAVHPYQLGLAIYLVFLYLGLKFTKPLMEQNDERDNKDLKKKQ